MQFKRCDQCNNMYAAEMTGLKSRLCRPCAMDCEQAFQKISKFLRHEHTEHHREFCVTDAEQIAQGAKVQAIFVKILFDIGRFESKKDEPVFCKSCSSALTSSERDYCGTCTSTLSRALQNSRLQSAAAAASEEPTPRMHRAAPRTDEKNNRYGLGR